MPSFYVEPSPSRGELDHGVIKEIILRHQRGLIDLGWTEVEGESDADIVAGHLGTESKRIDVFHCHGLYPTGVFDLPKGMWKANATIIENLRRANHVVAVSEWVADVLRRDMHMTPSVVGHGLDLIQWEQVGKPAPQFMSEPYVLWNKTRNVGVCDATPVLEMAKRMPKVKFVTTFLPDGAEAPPNVTVTGLLAKENMWPLVKHATVYMATTKETFGIGILEAMASGVPVVGYDWGAAPEILGDLGALVDPGDYDNLAAAISAAVSDEGQNKAALARQHVVSYAWENVLKELDALYRWMLEQIWTKRGPRVTVVIPCHNYEAYVGEAIQSVLAQTYQDFELIVVDDASEDHSVEAIEHAIEGDSRARLIKNERNLGVAATRNRGIEAGSGEYICCLDADDIMAPILLDTLVNGLDEDGSLGIVYTAIEFIDSEGEALGKQPKWPWEYDVDQGLHVNQVPTCCMYRRSWWERCGGYRTRFLSRHGAGQEDGDLWFRMLAYGAGAKKVTKDRLFKYRLHPDQATKKEREFWQRQIYHDWHPWVADEGHPFASQLARPTRESHPVRNYDRPKVAIVIPVGPRHTVAVADALDSVEAQTYRYWEVIVVNDSGKELDLRGWPYARLIDLEGKGNGPGFARNRGTEATKAPLVVYLDADDILQPMFVEETLKVWLDAGGWIYTDLFIYKDDGSSEVYKTPDFTPERLWRKGIAAVTCLYPREAWETVGGFDEKIQHEDWEFHIKLTLAGYCGTRLSAPMVSYRHTTGTRRLEGIEKKGYRDIKSRYSREAVMGCRCRKSPSRVPKARPVAQQPDHATRMAALASLGEIPGPGDNSFHLLRYVGQSESEIVFRGRSGRKYLFSTKRPFAWVHPVDAGRLLRKAVLRSADAAELKVFRTPELKVVEGVPALEGVNASFNA